MSGVAIKVFTIFSLITASLYFIGRVLGHNSNPSLNDNVDKHSVFEQPLTQGSYRFDSLGFIPSQPLERVKKIHREMIKSIQGIMDHKKQIQYLLTLCNTAHNDIEKLRQKLRDLEQGLDKPGSVIDRTHKADAFILLVSHAALMSNAVLYFPDTMKIMLQKNPTFDDNIKWSIEYSVKGNIVNDETILKAFNLAQQELNMIPKQADYQNPYKFNAQMPPETTTTKKPRKKLQRGPRLSSGGEL